MMRSVAILGDGHVRVRITFEPEAAGAAAATLFSTTGSVSFSSTGWLKRCCGPQVDASK